MKSNFKIVLIAFLSGLGGAFLYQRVLQPTTVTEVIREVPTYQQANNPIYEPTEDSPRMAIPVDFRAAAEKSVHSVVYIKKQSNNTTITFRQFI